VRIVTAVVVFSELKTSITNLSQNIPDRRHGIYLIKEQFLNISNVVIYFHCPFIPILNLAISLHICKWYALCGQEFT